MNLKRREIEERLLDILAAIERYRDRDRAAFERDELLQNWFLRHLQIIGEAAPIVRCRSRCSAGEGSGDAYPVARGDTLLATLTR